MAFTASLTARSVHGNEVVQYWTVTADGARGEFNTGLGTVVHVNQTYGSVTTANSVAYARLRLNATGQASASAGYIGFSGLTSGDVLYLQVYGR